MGAKIGLGALKCHWGLLMWLTQHGQKESHHARAAQHAPGEHVAAKGIKRLVEPISCAFHTGFRLRFRLSGGLCGLATNRGGDERDNANRARANGVVVHCLELVVVHGDLVTSYGVNLVHQVRRGGIAVGIMDTVLLAASATTHSFAATHPTKK